MSTFPLFTRRQFILSSLVSAAYCLSIPASNSAVVNKFEPFSFVFLTDCHLISGQPDSYKLTQESQLFLQDAIRQINILKPDFVIFGGDQVDSIGEEERNWQLFLDIVQALDCQWYFVFGESDISGNVPIDKLRTFGRDLAGKGLNTSQPYWSCNPVPGIKMIGLDTSKANSTIGDISSQQLNWLDNELSKNDSALTIVVSHHPLLPPAPFNTDNFGNQYLLPQAAEVRRMLESSGLPIISLSGHIHTSKIEIEKNVRYISCPSLDVYPCRFRQLKITPENIEVESHQINFPALVKKAKENLAASNFANSFNLARSRHKSFIDIASGTHLDQQALISINSNNITALKK